MAYISQYNHKHAPLCGFFFILLCIYRLTKKALDTALYMAF